MKILYITNGINGPGGLERVLSVKASYLADQLGYNVHIAGLNNGNETPFFPFSSRITFHSIKAGGHPLSYLRQYVKGIKELVKQTSPDIIAVCDDGLKGFFIPRLLPSGMPVIYERHVSRLIELNGKERAAGTMITKVKWSLMKRLAKDFDKFVVLTNGNTNEWPGLNNIAVIPNPLSFMPEVQPNTQSKKVICVGKISYQKGQDILLKAWEKVHESHKDWQLHLYGSPDDVFLKIEDGKLNIHHHLPVKDIETKYRESALYVLPSRFEGFGMVLIEAMATGLPCVAFDCNYGPSDIIKDQHEGMLVPVGNVMQLAEAINRLIESETLRVSMGHAAQKSVMRYTPERIMACWDELFKSLTR